MIPVHCENGQPEFSSTSRVARVEIGRSVIQLGGKPAKLNLGPLGTLYLNRFITTSEGDHHEVTRRAVEFDGPGNLDLVVAESRRRLQRESLLGALRLTDRASGRGFGPARGG